MNQPVEISASLQCAPPLALLDSVRQLEAGGIDRLHIDLMDAHFVPNLALNFDIMQALRRETALPMDTHLMMTAPQDYWQRAVDAGADMLCFHLEAIENPAPLLDAIRACGCSAGLAISPQTPVEALRPYLPRLDFVTVMSVRPGFAGQAFLPDTLDRIAWLDARRTDGAPALRICVDGGIGVQNGRACVARGANLLIAGSTCMFSATESLQSEARRFRQALTGEG